MGVRENMKLSVNLIPGSFSPMAAAALTLNFAGSKGLCYLTGVVSLLSPMSGSISSQCSSRLQPREQSPKND